MCPWIVQRDVVLAPYTTLGVGGKAAYFVSVTDLSWLPPLCCWAGEQGLSIAILGGGSNLVVADHGVSDLVLHLAADSDGADMQMQRQAEHLNLSVSARCVWDRLVSQSCAAGSFDLACLSGIPGTVGAAPVQNIGAYGQSLSDHLVGVDGVCLKTGETRTWARDALGLGYRTSYFKTAWQGQYAITRLHLRLRLHSQFVPNYPQLAAALAPTPDAQAPTPNTVRACVLALRAQKSMLWAPQDPNHRNVGSFFTNPIVPASHAQALCAAYPSMPSWPQNAYCKLSAAWLIEQAGFVKGMAHGPVGLSSRHSLALINTGGQALATDVVTFARVMQKAVKARFGVGLAAEPSFWGFGASHPLPAPVHQSGWTAPAPLGLS